MNQPSQAAFDRNDRLTTILRYVAIIAQFATIVITWEVWQVRQSPPNLPLLDGPQLSFGLALVATLAIALFLPRTGVWLQLAVLVVASLLDQYRLQPQILANWILMLATTYLWAARLGRWFLMSLWCWAGLHKLSSPDWWGPAAWSLVDRMGFSGDDYYLAFALVVGVSELGLGLLAWWKPKWAAVGCPLLHVGIVIFLSPWLANWNFSVIPWNLATALIGSWLLWNNHRFQKPRIPVPATGASAGRFGLRRYAFDWEAWVVVLLMVTPAGFYVSWMNHSYAHVLYSANLPNSMVTHLDGKSEPIASWNPEFHLPFPVERGLTRQLFEATARVGEKLHLCDPRPWLDDQYFVMGTEGAIPITPLEFFQADTNSPAGVAFDSEKARFELRQFEVQMLARDEEEIIYAVRFLPENYRPHLLKMLQGIQNVEQIQLQGTAVTDEDLSCLIGLPKLLGIGLSDTRVTDKGVGILKSIPTLQVIEHENTAISNEAMMEFIDSRRVE